METITFYSYKGGVGRTLTLANIAVYLSRFGKNVCLLDFDLEAPGLHYKFLDEKGIGKIKKGIVEYLNFILEKKYFPPSLKEYSLEIVPQAENIGSIHLIPAGNISNPIYWKMLSSLNWHDLFYSKNPIGLPLFLEIKELIEKEYNPDFLLIDSRTGVAEMSGVCTSQLPDKVVMLMVNNRENIDGINMILNSIQETERIDDKKADIHIALTRISLPKEDKDIEREKSIIDGIKSKLNISEISILHSNRELEFKEFLSINQDDFSIETPLQTDYLRLFSKIISAEAIMPAIEKTTNKILNVTWDDRDNPDNIQKELESIAISYPHPEIYKKLIYFYIFRNVDRDTLLKSFHQLWKRTDGNIEQKLLPKYISYFMKWDFSPYGKERFLLEIVEKYLENEHDDDIKVKIRLAKAYFDNNILKVALKHYLEIIEKSTDPELEIDILNKILDIYIAEDLFSEAEDILLNTRFSSIIEQDKTLKVKKLRVLYKLNKKDDANVFIKDIEVLKILRKDNFILYSKIVSWLGIPINIIEELNSELNIATRNRDDSNIYELGKIYYEQGREEIFKERIGDKDGQYDDIIRDLDRKFSSKFHDFPFNKPTLRFRNI